MLEIRFCSVLRLARNFRLCRIQCLTFLSSIASILASNLRRLDVKFLGRPRRVNAVFVSAGSRMADADEIALHVPSLNLTTDLDPHYILARRRKPALTVGLRSTLVFSGARFLCAFFPLLV